MPVNVVAEVLRGVLGNLMPGPGVGISKTPLEITHSSEIRETTGDTSKGPDPVGVDFLYTARAYASSLRIED